MQEIMKGTGWIRCHQKGGAFKGDGSGKESVPLTTAAARSEDAQVEITLYWQNQEKRSSVDAPTMAMARTDYGNAEETALRLHCGRCPDDAAGPDDAVRNKLQLAIHGNEEPEAGRGAGL
jgi:hypothetical protein